MASVTYVHEATLVLINEDDDAPGAAVTVALCAHSDHMGPCRWPHHTSSYRQGDKRIVRTVVVAPEDELDEVTGRIRRALAGGPWTVISQAETAPEPDEQALAARLRRSVETT